MERMMLTTPLPPRSDWMTLEKHGALFSDIASAELELAQAQGEWEASGYAIHDVSVFQRESSEFYKARIVVSDPRYYGAGVMWEMASLGVSYA